MITARPQSPRARSPRSPPPLISYPLPFDYTAQPHSPTASSPTASMHKLPHQSHSRKPSVTNPMTWLSRSNNTSPTKSQPYSPSKPVRISEPKYSNLFDIVNNPRSGPLGSGATVVKTPHEALCGSAVHLTFEGVEKFEPTVEEEEPAPEHDRRNERSPDRYSTPPQSPPLPPIPLSPVLIFETTRKAKPQSQSPPPQRFSTPSPPVVHAQLRSSFKTRPPPDSEFSPPVPLLPSNISASPPQPPFEAIVISPLSTYAIDPSKVIISLETSTATHRTTLSTLNSRPSHLASYVSSLIPSTKQDTDSLSVDDSSAPSPTTPDSTFHSLFQNHLASSGLLPPVSATIHIFLDRPSAPYAHILSYLRTAPATPEYPATLPHAVQLISSSTSRLEALLTLRDEARYLDLDELYKLCTDEIRQRYEQAPGLHKRVYRSSRGSSSGVGSLNSSHTLRDPVDQDPRFVYRDSGETKSVHVRLSDPDKRSAMEPSLPQSPVSKRRRSQSLVNIVTPPPTGWI